MERQSPCSAPAPLARACSAALVAQLALLCLVQAADLPKQIVAQPIQVLSGDSFLIRYEGRTILVRLEGIDAPERDQSFFDGARAALSRTLLGKTVTIQPISGDAKQLVGRVSSSGKSINKQMVAEGNAWFDESIDSPSLATAQRDAQRRKLGLWAIGTPIPPWEWRDQTAAGSVPSLDGAEQPGAAPKKIVRRFHGRKPVKEIQDAIMEVARKFTNAWQQHDRDAIKELLSERARKHLEPDHKNKDKDDNKGDQTQPPPAPSVATSAELGEVLVSRDEAEVDLTTTEMGEKQSGKLLLRKMGKHWRVFGLRGAGSEDEPGPIRNFEKLDEEMIAGVMDALAKGLKDLNAAPMSEPPTPNAKITVDQTVSIVGALLAKKGAATEARAQLTVLTQNVASIDPDERKSLIAELAKLFAEHESNPAAPEIAGAIAGAIQSGDAALAAQAYRDFAGVFSKSSDEQVRRAAARMEGSARQLELPGNFMDLAGTLVDGKPFDWSAYRGKVVLVDFWATWCGPCREELPNVKKNYDLYHARGFEVVGVSLDDDRKRLEEFLNKEQLPWNTLFSDDPKATGWNHPMAVQYGIVAIPAVFLLDKEGKVVSMRARGDALGAELEKLLGPQVAGGAKDPAEANP